MGGGSSSCVGIGCCSKSYHLDPKADKGAIWCANEGGRCSADGGKAEIYYGWGLTWQRKTLAKGSEIKCGNGNMGCDPLPGTRKYCFKVQQYDPNQPICCQGLWQISRFGVDYSDYAPATQYDNYDAAIAEITKTTKSSIRDGAEERGFDGDTVVDAADVPNLVQKIFNQICEPEECSGNSAHSVSKPHDDIVWTPENMYNLEMPSLFQMDLYLVPVIAFFLLFLSCVQCWSLVKRCKRRLPKKYAVVKRIDYESEVGTDEAMPMK